MSWVVDREFIPTTGGNDQAPDDERVVITYKPFAMGEKPAFMAEFMKRSQALVGTSKDARDKLAAMKDDGTDVDVDTLAELLSGTGDATDNVLRYVIKERVTGGRRGDDKVSGYKAVWDRIQDDEILVAEIAMAIIESMGVGTEQRPTSEPPSTGGAKG